MPKIIQYLKLIAIPVGIAFVFYFIFNLNYWGDIWAIMSLSFFFGLPYLTGVVAIYVSKEQLIKRLAYRILFPWIPILVFFLMTLFLSMEGWACWIMILPIFMILASLGGLTAGYFRMRKSKTLDRLQIPLAILLPFVAGPVEQAIGPNLSHFKAYTSIEIESSREVIWSHVTRVAEISEDEDAGTLNKFLGIPRPIKAELNYEGLHAVRKASFTGGLIFTETVTSYEHERFMEFSIEPNTGEISSTTFDEHVLIGGQYFDVLKGTYSLEEIAPGYFRLHLWSEFQLNTTFNFYSGMWAKWIMSDIQQNILTVIKKRSE